MMAPKSGEILTNTIMQKPINENVNLLNIRRFIK